ncbi:MAG: methyltransferase domain-containing protein [Anaerolineae bacterium]|nr:methyltransferase domain-containing protein [Anaerolineae bacterium]
MDEERRICNYEGSDYCGDFWEGQGRDYEDLAERIALRRLLPDKGRRLVDLGGAFGRLSEFYGGYEQVVLVDYSLSLLRQAQARLGRDGRMVYVAASLYELPFADSAFDAAMMVRVIHHIEDVPAALAEIGRCLAGSGAFVLEFASKRHLKSIVRYALRAQQWSPFDQAPYEFAPMHFDFHPAWMRARLAEAGFHVKRQRTVSHFRQAMLKRLIPPRALAALDGACQPTGRWWQLTPSVFVQCLPAARKVGEVAPADRLFRCPMCGGLELEASAEALTCRGCGRHWGIEDGIYNLKAPLST